MRPLLDQYMLPIHSKRRAAFTSWRWTCSSCSDVHQELLLRSSQEVFCCADLSIRMEDRSKATPVAEYVEGAATVHPETTRRLKMNTYAVHLSLSQANIDKMISSSSCVYNWDCNAPGDTPGQHILTSYKANKISELSNGSITATDRVSSVWDCKRKTELELVVVEKATLKAVLLLCSVNDSTETLSKL